MLCLLLHIDTSVFALPCAAITRIVPNVPLEQIPKAPSCVAGLMHYRGGSVPVVDLSELMRERPSREVMSSRIVLINYHTGTGGVRLLGLLAEKVMQTIELDEQSLKDSGIHLASTPYLGKVASTSLGLIQLLDSQKLLPESLKDQFFTQP